MRERKIVRCGEDSMFDTSRVFTCAKLDGRHLATAKALVYSTPKGCSVTRSLPLRR